MVQKAHGANSLPAATPQDYAAWERIGIPAVSVMRVTVEGETGEKYVCFDITPQYLALVGFAAIYRPELAKLDYKPRKA